MGETYGLSVAHIEPVRRIARRVERTSGAGRYFAVGASAEVRDRVEHALAALLGDAGRVVSLDVSAIEGDPWNWIRERKETGAGRVLYCVRGLGDLANAAAAAGRPNPYAQLNLSRDAWGATGTHLLVWLDGLAAFDTFLHHAPDLWSHRDVVAWFLSRADFLPAEEPAEGEDRIAARIAEARAVLEKEGVTAQDRLQASIELADMLTDRGEFLEAWQAVLVGEATLRRMEDGHPQSAALKIAIAEHRALVLSDLDRQEEAGRGIRHVLASHPNVPAWVRLALQKRAAVFECSVRPEIALPRLRDHLVAPDPSANADERAFSTRSNFVEMLTGLGRVGTAQDALAEMTGASAGNRAWMALRRASIAVARGDFPYALRVSEHALAHFRGTGELRVRSPAANAAIILDSWGDTSESDALFASAIQGDTAHTLLPRVRLYLSRWRRSSLDAAPVLADILSSIQTLSTHPIARAVAANAVSELLEDLERDAEPTDPVFPTLDAALQTVSRASKPDDPEVDGWTRWSLARLALLRGDPERAYALADRVLLKWAHRWRGLIAQAEIWGLLARSAPTIAIAAERAASAVRTADSSPSLYAQIDARQTAATVHLRAGALPAAVAALHEARALARSEGLRPRELAVLHDLAELPGFPDAKAAAREALALAESMLLPREEARALLNLLEIARRAGEPLAPRRLERVTEVVDELGPPRLRARLRAFHRTGAAR